MGVENVSNGGEMIVRMAVVRDGEEAEVEKFKGRSRREEQPMSHLLITKLRPHPDYVVSISSISRSAVSKHSPNLDTLLSTVLIK